MDEVRGTAVNHPDHYNSGYCETIYEIRDILGPEGFKAFCLGNWIKYNARAQYKSGEEDRKKADVYLEWATKGLPPLNTKIAQITSPSFAIGCIVSFTWQPFGEEPKEMVGVVTSIAPDGWYRVRNKTGSYYEVYGGAMSIATMERTKEFYGVKK